MTVEPQNRADLIAEIEVNLENARMSHRSGRLPSDTRLQLLSRAADALAQSDKKLKRLGEELEDAEDRRGNEYLKLENTVAEQDAMIQSIRVAAGQKDWQWVYEALAKTHNSGTEGTR